MNKRKDILHKSAMILVLLMATVIYKAGKTGSYEQLLAVLIIFPLAFLVGFYIRKHMDKQVK